VSARTGIQWTDHTFNIAWGCIRVSPGCENCYAETIAKRMGFKVWGPAKTTERRTLSANYWREPLRWNRAAERDGRRHRVFCSSMADVFENHPTIDAERSKLWPLIRSTPWLDWQLLTKRPERIAANLPEDWGQGFPNVWLGVSVENQETANERVPLLAQTPAAVRFLSCEPLLGPIDFGECGSRGGEDGDPFAFSALADADGVEPPIPGIDWCIIGGESGRHARPCNVEWIRDIVAQCGFAGTAVFVKQMGAWVRGDHAEFRRGVVDRWLLDNGTVWVPGVIGEHNFRRPENAIAFRLFDSHGGDWSEWPLDLQIRQFPPFHETAVV
jgi:protein gp37